MGVGPLPTDNTNPPNSAGDGNQITGFAGGNVELKYSTFDGGITLGTNDVNTSPYGVVHGPYIVSKDTVSLEVGDTFSFKWQAVGSGDAADVFAYLVDQGDGSIIQLLDYTHNSFGATPLQSVSETINRQGDYKFVFVSGSYDENGGGRVGSQVSIRDLNIVQANPSNARVTNAKVVVEATEANSVQISASSLTQMQNKVAQDPGTGIFSIVSGVGDHSKFSIDQNGNISSTQTLTRSLKSNYNFDVKYVASNGKTHIENVTLNLQSGLGATTNLAMQEAGQLNIALDNFALLRNFHQSASGGNFSISNRADGNKFMVQQNGMVQSRNAINFEDGANLDFDIVYTATDGRVFTNRVQLTISDTDTSTAILTAEESNSVKINKNALSSSQSYAFNVVGGNFSLEGNDASSFYINGNGDIVSQSPLLLANKSSFNFNYVYRVGGTVKHTERVTLSLTEALQATSTLFVNEANSIRISRDTLQNLNEFASRDNYSGVYSLANSAEDPDDFQFFQINTAGLITSIGTLDPNLQNEFSFDAIYTASNGTSFRETINLTLSASGEPVTTIKAAEGQTVSIASSEFKYTNAASVATPGGTFSLLGSDASDFSIDATGNVTANQQPLLVNRGGTYNPQRNFNFVVQYSVGGVVQSSENIRLIISETLSASSNLTVAESKNRTTIEAETLSSVNNYALRDRKGGTYSLSSNSGDHNSFSVNSVGEVASNTGLEFDQKQTYSFKLNYQSVDGQIFSENINLTVLDTFASDANLSSEETNILNINNSELSSSFAFANKDPGNGTFSLSGADAGLFTIDNSGNINSNGALLRSNKTDYSFNVIYTASYGAIHTEAVSLSLTEALQGTSNLTAAEAGNVQILLDRLTNLSGFASRDGSSGNFRIDPSSVDANKFSIAPNGNINSIGALDFDTQSTYNINVIYSGSDGRTFTDAITLNLNDTLNSNAIFTAEESSQVEILISDLSASNQFSTKDPGAGIFSLSGADANYFSLIGNKIVSKQPLTLSSKANYIFNLDYTSSLGSTHSEQIVLNLTRYLQSDTVLSAHEAGQVNLGRDIFSELDAFAASDGYRGTYRLERYDNNDGNPGNDGDADDFTQFAMNPDGSVYSRTALDFTTENQFHFNKVYTASDGRVFTDRVILNLTDTLSSTASMQVEESNQIVINISDLTASNTYATQNPGGGFAVVSANNLFQLVGNQIIANKEFRKEDQSQYTFDLIYSHGGTQHTENVTVDLTRFMQSQGTLTADEANMVIMSSDAFEHLFSFTNDNLGGAYSLTGADATLFELNDSGDVVSKNPLDYDVQKTYNFNVTYTMPDGTAFNSQVQLDLRDTLASKATLQCEEAREVIVNGNTLTSLKAHALKDGNQGYFELLNRGDYDKFTMAADGTLTSKGELRMSVDPELDVYIKYHGVGVDDMVEHVRIQLTPTQYDHSRSQFIAKESGEVVIVPQLNTYMQAYAAADNYAGRWEIAQSPYAVDIDTAFFEVADNTGQLKTTQRIDFESGKTDFEIILYYHHSSNTKKYTDFLHLNIINDKRDDNNLALEDIDISTREGAAAAAIHLQKVIDRINNAQAKLGAIENRFTHNVDNLSMAVLNTEEAAGRILDADFALESTRLARSQILDQAATDMLVRANQAKQNLLMLINS